MTNYTQAGKEMADRLFVGESRNTVGIEKLCNELGELRTRLEKLERCHALEQLDG
jgi:hypothetical protein